MNGHPSRQRPESVQTPVPTTVPIAEAAARLGISVDAVRKRIQRGKLTGQKTDSGWTVVWIEPDIRPDNVQTPVPESSALVDDLRDQVAYLRDQLAVEREARAEADRRHATEIERRDVLMREALERIPQLPPGGSHTPAGASSDGPSDAQGRITPPGRAPRAPESRLGSSPLPPLAWRKRRRWLRRVLRATLDDMKYHLVLGAALAALLSLPWTYIGVALTTAGQFLSWENLGKAAIISTILAIPLGAIGVWLAWRSSPRR